MKTFPTVATTYAASALCAKIISPFRTTIRGVLLTAKVNNAATLAFAAVPTIPAASSAFLLFASATQERISMSATPLVLTAPFARSLRAGQRSLVGTTTTKMLVHLTIIARIHPPLAALGTVSHGALVIPLSLQARPAYFRITMLTAPRCGTTLWTKHALLVAVSQRGTINPLTVHKRVDAVQRFTAWSAVILRTKFIKGPLNATPATFGIAVLATPGEVAATLAFFRIASARELQVTFQCLAPVRVPPTILACKFLATTIAALVNTTLSKRLFATHTAQARIAMTGAVCYLAMCRTKTLFALVVISQLANNSERMTHPMMR